MALPIFLPMIISALAGAVGSGVAANQTSRMNRAQARAAAERRQNLEQLIARINKQTQGMVGNIEDSVQSMRNADTTSTRLDSASRTLNAQFSGSNLGDSDYARQIIGSEFARQIIEDQARKEGVELQAQQVIAGIMGQAQGMEGQLRSDASFGTVDPNEFNVGMDTFLGTFTGLLGGAAQQLGAQTSTGEGMNQLVSAWEKLFAQGAPTNASLTPAVQAPTMGNSEFIPQRFLGTGSPPIPSLPPFPTTSGQRDF